MIIERITAIRVIPPKVTQVPIRRISQQIESVHTVGSGERQILGGATGSTVDISFDDVEVGFYSPRDIIVFAQQSQAQSR